MTEQGGLLQLMIKNEMRKHKGSGFSVSNQSYVSPELIKVLADEIVFVVFIRIEAGSDFVLEFYSANEIKTIERSISSDTIVEDNIISQHNSSISFNMSNSDTYRVSVVKLKIIK